MQHERIYLDYAATAPLRPEAAAAMLPFLGGAPLNPSSAHAEGRAARSALDGARSRVAGVLGMRPAEIVFTGGGSEAIALAIAGTARALAHRGRHIVTSAVEHHAVLHTCDALRDDGWEITVLPVDGDGLVDPDAFAASLRSDTVLASIMYANNEVATVQPIAHLAAAARERGIRFFTDAVQAPGLLPLDVNADLIALSAHKFGGPVGVGILGVRAPAPLAPIVAGGGQERGRRSGTENVAGIAGAAEALVLAEAERSAAAERLARLGDRLLAAILDAIPEARSLGSPTARLPGRLSVAFANTPADALLARLDLEGVAASSGSACASGAMERSHVIAALGVPERFAGGVVRLSLGCGTTEAQVERVIALLPPLVAQVRGSEPASV